MRRVYGWAVAFLVAVSSTLAWASCDDQLFHSLAPVLQNDKLAPRTKQLCFSEFAVMHSGLSRTPLWSAEHLTANRLEAARAMTRHNTFHEEEQLDPEDRSTLDDYRRSGFDRGHMSPNGDMSTEEAQEECFSLANMVPQQPCHNEVLWESIESAVREFAKEHDVFVVTGPAFLGSGDEIESLKGRVLIPTHIFKAIYIPDTNEAAAYWTPNDASQQWDIITINELTKNIGIDVFPAVASEVKEKVAALPQPGTPHHKCRLRN